MNIARYEPMAIQTPKNEIKNMSCCGWRDILYRPLVTNWSGGVFLKLKRAMMNPAKPRANKIIPMMKTLAPIFNGVKIIKPK